MPYPALEAFVAPARARPALWRAIAGFLLVMLCVALFPLPIMGTVKALGGDLAMYNFFDALFLADTPGAILFALTSFGGMALGVVLAARLLQGRGPGTLFGPGARLWQHFAIATTITFAVFALSALIPSDTAVTPNLDPDVWAMFAISGVLALLLQTGAEEMLFRGYLQQQMAARFRSPAVFILVPSAIFGLLHPGPPELGLGALSFMLVPFLFGLLAADLTAVTGGLGAAWGFHFANNAVGVLIVSAEGQLSGLALYTAQIDIFDPDDRAGLLLTSGVTTLVVWAAIRFVLTRGRRIRDPGLSDRHRA